MESIPYDRSTELAANLFGVAQALCEALGVDAAVGVRTVPPVAAMPPADVAPPTPIRPAALPAAAASLTGREREVMQLLALGWRDRQIGETLRIETRSVSWHVSNILKKLGLPSRTAAATYAIRHGLA